MKPIDERPIATAGDEDLRRWQTNLTTALDAPCPPDVPAARWDEERSWVEALRVAIETELDRRRRLGDTHDGSARTRAAI